MITTLVTLLLFSSHFAGTVAAECDGEYCPPPTTTSPTSSPLVNICEQCNFATDDDPINMKTAVQEIGRLADEFIMNYEQALKEVQDEQCGDDVVCAKSIEAQQAALESFKGVVVASKEKMEPLACVQESLGPAIFPVCPVDQNGTPVVFPSRRKMQEIPEDILVMVDIRGEFLASFSGLVLLLICGCVYTESEQDCCGSRVILMCD